MWLIRDPRIRIILQWIADDHGICSLSLVNKMLVPVLEETVSQDRYLTHHILKRVGMYKDEQYLFMVSAVHVERFEFNV